MSTSGALGWCSQKIAVPRVAVVHKGQVFFCAGAITPTPGAPNARSCCSAVQLLRRRSFGEQGRTTHKAGFFSPALALFAAKISDLELSIRKTVSDFTSRAYLKHKQRSRARISSYEAAARNGHYSKTFIAARFDTCMRLTRCAHLHAVSNRPRKKCSQMTVFFIYPHSTYYSHVHSECGTGFRSSTPELCQVKSHRPQTDGKHHQPASRCPSPLLNVGSP